MAPSLRELYPDLTEKELKEVEETLDRYLALVIKIFERIEAEKVRFPLGLTPPGKKE